MPFRENLLAAFTAFFDYIPSKREYSQISADENTENSLLLQASQILYEISVFQNSAWLKNTSTNSDKASIILEKLLPNISSNESIYTEAKQYIEALLNQQNLTESLYIAVDALLNSNSDALQDSKNILIDKIALSEYVITQGGSLPLQQTEITEILQSINQAGTSLADLMQYVDQATQSWHFMVYMMADNNLEAYALLDLQELSDLAATEQASISVAIDRSAGYNTSFGNWTDTRYGSVEGNQTIASVINQLTSAGEVNMGNSDALTAFIDWSVSHNPADHYTLILWDHGLGYEGIGIDEGNQNDVLTLAEIEQGISNSTLGQVDQIIFDACSMAMIEVATALSSVTEIIVASQDIVPSVGINYSELADQIIEFNGIGNSEALGHLVLQSYSEYFSQLSSMALSMLDTAETADFITAANTFSKTVLAAPNSDWLKIQQARNNSEYYYDNKSIDLDSFLTNLIQQSPSQSLNLASENLLNASHEIVIENTATKEQSEGLSIYWPSSDLGQFYQNQYLKVATELGLPSWGNLIDHYWEL